VSLNGGIDWAPQSADFMFYEEPHMTRLSFTQVNLKANVPLTIHGLYFRPDITFCKFDEEKIVPLSVTPTTVTCMLFPQPYPKLVRVTLQVSDNYIVYNSYLYFMFENSIQITHLDANEGYIDGGNTVHAYGNFSYFYNKNYTLFLGAKQVPPEQILLSTPTEIDFVAPAVDKAMKVQLYIKHQGVTYTNETVLYYYKTYSVLASINPNYGPTQGGTLVEVHG
jgi:hypothetical protein